MLRQLWRLTRPVPAAGPNALALAIYEHPTGVVHAEESGFEGVACVDDTARLLTVLCSLEEDAPAWVERWARGLLDFVLWMQEPDGAWINFVMDWDGDKNRTGITSEPGQNFWLARALVATQAAGWAFGDSDAMEAYRRGLARSVEDRKVVVPGGPYRDDLPNPCEVGAKREPEEVAQLEVKSPTHGSIMPRPKGDRCRLGQRSGMTPERHNLSDQ